MTSLFLSRSAWGGSPEWTWIHRCRECDFRFYERGLSDSEAEAFYRTYRSTSYFVERRRDEPFYTKAAHDGTEQFLRSPERPKSVMTVLGRAGVRPPLGSVLDYGGGDGRLIAPLDATRKAVYDIGAAPPVSGVEALITEPVAPEWDLVICAQTLEHVSDPLGLLRRIVQVTRQQGNIYLEVPRQIWKSLTVRGGLRDSVLRFAQRHRPFHIGLDVYSTAFRVKAGVLPPFGLIPMREHINFFTPAALAAICRRAGAEVLYCGPDMIDSLAAVAQKQ